MSDFGGDTGLHVEITANSDEATSALGSLGKGAEDAAAVVVAANEKIAQSAQHAGESISVAAGASAKDSAQMAHAFSDSARLADQAVAETGDRAVQQAAQRGREVLAEVKRELEAIRNDVRAGELTQQDALGASRGAMQTAQTHAGGQYTRQQLSVGNLEGDPEMQSRYRAYVEAERQIRTIQDQMVRDQRVAVESQVRADKDSSDSAMQSARLRSDALRQQVRTQQISLEEEGRLLQSARAQYSEYADARALIDKRIVDNQVRSNAEQTRSQGRGGGVAGNSLLNAGYVIPGPLGNAATNLGYAAQGGPAEFAVLGGAIAAFGAGGALYKAAEIAAKDQEAMERLSTAVRTQGGDWKGLATNVDAWAQLQERTTIFGRDQTIPALTELATAGIRVADAQKIVRVAEDASAATGKPLTEITHELLNAYNGNARGLIQLGVATRAQIHDGMSFSDVLALIEKNMSGQATTVVGFSRHQEQLGHDFEELARHIGDELLPDLDKATTSLDKFVRSLDNEKSIKGFVHDLEALAHALGTVNDALSYDNTVGKWLKHEDDLSGNRGATQQVYDPETHRATTIGVGGGGAGSPVGPARLGLPGGDLNSSINTAAARYGIDPAVLRAVGDQESGLGRSPAYDPRSGLSRTPGNAGHGIFQLDPASGASTTDLNRAAHDVGFAADRAAQMLATDLKAAGGNLTTALATYNAGGPNAKGLAYAQEVEGRLGPTAAASSALGLNPASTNVQGRGAIGNRQSTDLDKAYMQYEAELKAGFGGARQEYEQALSGIAADTTKSLQERTAAERAYNSLVKQDAAEQVKAVAEQTKAERDKLKIVEESMRVEETRDNTTRVRAGNTQQAYAAEIAALTKLRDSRQAAGDVNSERDVANLDGKITRLTEVSGKLWKSVFTDAQKHFAAGNESLDAYLAKLQKALVGATTLEKHDIFVEEARAINKGAKDSVGTDQAAITLDEKNGMPRAALEKTLNDLLRDVNSRSNYGQSGAQEAYNSEAVSLSSKLGGMLGTDVADQLRRIDNDFKQRLSGATLAQGASTLAIYQDPTLNAQQRQADLAAQQATKVSDLDKIQAQLDREHIQRLKELQGQYQQTYGTTASTVIEGLQRQIEGLQTTEHDLADKTVQDERGELQQRLQQYQQFADSATSHLAGIFTQGSGGIREMGAVWKNVLGDMENQFLKSAIGDLFFKGQGGGDMSFGHALETGLFGGVAPKGQPGMFGGDTTANEDAKLAFRKIANSPTGSASSPLSVSLIGGPGGGGGLGSGILPGGDSALQSALAGSQLYGPIGALFGSSGAAELLGSMPIGSSGIAAGVGAAEAGIGIPGLNLSGGGAGGLGGGGGMDAQTAWDLAMGGGLPEGGAPAGSSGGGGGLAGLLNRLKPTGGAATAWGGIAQGFGLGEAANSALGGNQLYGTIGSGLGAGVGSIFGGPVGSERSAARLAVP